MTPNQPMQATGGAPAAMIPSSTFMGGAPPVPDLFR